MLLAEDAIEMLEEIIINIYDLQVDDGGVRLVR